MKRFDLIVCVYIYIYFGYLRSTRCSLNIIEFRGCGVNWTWKGVWWVYYFSSWICGRDTRKLPNLPQECKANKKLFWWIAILIEAKAVVCTQLWYTPEENRTLCDVRIVTNQSEFCRSWLHYIPIVKFSRRKSMNQAGAAWIDKKEERFCPSGAGDVHLIIVFNADNWNHDTMALHFSSWHLHEMSLARWCLGVNFNMFFIKI